MRRYRLLRFDFDSLPLIMQTPAPTDPEQLRQWTENRSKTEQWVRERFGAADFQAKWQNYLDFGGLPFSVLAYHNIFVHEIRNAFVVGGYYPALTGLTTLTERILNYLIVGLRDEYPINAGGSRVRTKNSFDDWGFMIEILKKWTVLQPSSEKYLRRLSELRNEAVHWGRGEHLDWRGRALEAGAALREVVTAQFGLANQAWFLDGLPGEIYIKRAWEQDPYVSFVYLPSATYVGPQNRVEVQGTTMTNIDDVNYPDEDLTDDEFVARRRAFQEGAASEASGP